MRVRLQDWFRSLTLVPWYEAEHDRGDAGRVGLVELRRVIASEPGSSSALRKLIHELDHSIAGLAFLDEHELAHRIVELIERGLLRVEAEPEAPRPSEAIVRHEPVEYEPPETLEEDLLLFWVEDEADDWPELVVEDECEPWPEFDTTSTAETLEFDTSSS